MDGDEDQKRIDIAERSGSVMSMYRSKTGPIVLHVVLEERGVGTLQRGVRQIELIVFTGRVALDRRESTVEATDHQPPVAQQLLPEARGIDAQVRALDVIDRQTGEARQLLGDCFPLGGRHPVTFRQRREVFAERKRARLVHRLPQVA
jgi:hypothetical protein